MLSWPRAVLSGTRNIARSNNRPRLQTVKLWFLQYFALDLFLSCRWYSLVSNLSDYRVPSKVLKAIVSVKEDLASQPNLLGQIPLQYLVEVTI